MRSISVLLVAAIVAFGFAGVTKPSELVRAVPDKSTVILAMDVSGSMRATDITPSRLEAMQAGTKAFIAQQAKNVSIGIVAFAGAAFLVQPPTTDHTALNTAIEHLELQPRTAVGSGILTALSALFPDEDFGISPTEKAGNSFGGGGSTAFGSAPQKKSVLVEPGSDEGAVIILLTDGASNTGQDPIEAARTAANHGVRVYTVGFGTNGSDEETLKRIADITRAQYFQAGSAEDFDVRLNAITRQSP